MAFAQQTRAQVGANKARSPSDENLQRDLPDELYDRIVRKMMTAE
jgi:hypothetical protein